MHTHTSNLSEFWSHNKKKMRWRVLRGFQILRHFPVTYFVQRRVFFFFRLPRWCYVFFRPVSRCLVFRFIHCVHCQCWKFAALKSSFPKWSCAQAHVCNIFFLNAVWIQLFCLTSVETGAHSYSKNVLDKQFAGLIVQRPKDRSFLFHTNQICSLKLPIKKYRTCQRLSFFWCTFWLYDILSTQFSTVFYASVFRLKLNSGKFLVWWSR